MPKAELICRSDLSGTSGSTKETVTCERSIKPHELSLLYQSHRSKVPDRFYEPGSVDRLQYDKVSFKILDKKT